MTIIKTNQLAQALLGACKILPKNKAKRSIFEYVLVSQESFQIVKIVVSNLVISVTFNLDIINQDNSRKLMPTLLPLKLLSRLINKMSSQVIRLSNDDKGKALNISTSHDYTSGEYSIKSEDVSQFPDSSYTSINVVDSHTVCIDREGFKQIVECLGFVGKSISSVLTNVYLKHDIDRPTNLLAWASDGTFFVEQEIPLHEPMIIGSTYQAILSSEFVLTVWAIEWDTITLKFSDKAITANTETMTISQRQDQELVKTYPDFDRILRLSYLNARTYCTVNRLSLLATIERCKSYKVVAIATGLNNEIKVVASSESTITEAISVQGGIENSFGVYCTKRIATMLKSTKQSNIFLASYSKDTMLLIKSDKSIVGIKGHNNLTHLPDKLKDLSSEVGNAVAAIQTKSPDWVNSVISSCEDVLPKLASIDVFADNPEDIDDEISPCELKDFDHFDNDDDFFKDKEEVIDNDSLNEDFDNDDDFFKD